MNSLLDSNNVKYIIGVLIIIVILYMIMQPVPPNTMSVPPNTMSVPPNTMSVPPNTMSQNPIPLTLDQQYKNIIQELESINSRINTAKYHIDHNSPNKINLINYLNQLYIRQDQLSSQQAILNDKLKNNMSQL